MKNILKTSALFITVLCLFGILGVFFGGTRGVLYAVLFAVGWNLFIFVFCDRIILRSCRAIPISRESVPEVYKIVSDLCEKSALAKPRIYLIPSASPNIFSVGRSSQNSTIALSKGLIELLNYEELTGVLSREISRIKNYDVLFASKVAGLSGSILLISAVLEFLLHFGGRSHGRGTQQSFMSRWMTKVFMFPVSFLIWMTIPKGDQYEADSQGARLCGEPLYLASALLKIDCAAKQVALRGIPLAFAHLFILSPFPRRKGAFLQIYPSVEERIGRLERMEEVISYDV